MASASGQYRRFRLIRLLENITASSTKLFRNDQFVKQYNSARHYLNLLNTRVPFVPPNPKEFVNAPSMSTSRAS